MISYRISMKLSGPMRKELEAALADAFPTGMALARMVRYQLGETLTQITEGTALADIIFTLVNWTEAQDKVLELIRAALNENPHNAALASVANQMDSQM